MSNRRGFWSNFMTRADFLSDFFASCFRNKLFIEKKAVSDPEKKADKSKRIKITKRYVNESTCNINAASLVNYYFCKYNKFYGKFANYC